MAEKIILKARIAGIDFAPVIADAAGLETAVWVEQPLTLKDDEVSITEGDATETVVYSHENDAPEDVDYVGVGLSAQGSFIKATYDQMEDLMGGSVTGTGATAKYLHPTAKKVVNTAIRFRLKNGGAIIVPCAKGTVNFNGKLTADGTLKLPFKFRLLGQTAFPTDYVLQDTFTA